MSLLRTHAVLMFFYAFATAIFFALLRRNTRRDRIRVFLIIFCSMVLGAIVLGWAMYPYPLHR